MILLVFNINNSIWLRLKKNMYLQQRFPENDIDIDSLKRSINVLIMQSYQ